jgi:TonB family protein
LLIGAWLVRHPVAAPPSVEVDLTDLLPVLGGGPAKLGAPKKMVPEAKGIPQPAENNIPPKPTAAPTPPKDWVLPGPETKVVEKAAEPAPTPGGSPEGTGTAAKTGGSGYGSDYGVPNGTGSGGSGLLQFPKLLNRDELLANLRRFYPESERSAGHEASVKVYLHIGTDGKVDPVDIAASAGAAFDSAAIKVAQHMLFSPAIGPKGPVAVKLPQIIIFRLQD